MLPAAQQQQQQQQQQHTLRTRKSHASSRRVASTPRALPDKVIKDFLDKIHMPILAEFDRAVCIDQFGDCGTNKSSTRFLTLCCVRKGLQRKWIEQGTKR